ncbi:hypothetical protein E2C01_021521 [Portunus trituberculatus]|uniref:Uncharacterized protein n=1 Tax=Portunus trituberculatus TaxID=210409 RepID=A0A5B7E2Y4_PORTR|nr:hypothetical protein [Portunus trituberculatus]
MGNKSPVNPYYWVQWGFIGLLKATARSTISTQEVRVRGAQYPKNQAVERHTAVHPADELPYRTLQSFQEW